MYARWEYLLHFDVKKVRYYISIAQKVILFITFQFPRRWEYLLHYDVPERDIIYYIMMSKLMMKTYSTNSSNDLKDDIIPMRWHWGSSVIWVNDMSSLRLATRGTLSEARFCWNLKYVGYKTKWPTQQVNK